MGRVIAIANQKGGVGKTTTAINLGASLAIAERRTLVIDCDPQGNATSGFGLRKDSEIPSVYDCLVDGTDMADAVRTEVHFPCLSVISASRDLAGAELELVDRPHRERVSSGRAGEPRKWPRGPRPRDQSAQKCRHAAAKPGKKPVQFPMTHP